jgi:integrase
MIAAPGTARERPLTAWWSAQGLEVVLSQPVGDLLPQHRALDVGGAEVNTAPHPRVDDLLERLGEPIEAPGGPRAVAERAESDLVGAEVVLQRADNRAANAAVSGGVVGKRRVDRATDARAFEAKLRTFKRSGALADLDAGTETLAEFVEEWWLVYAGPNLERSTLRVYAQLWNGQALPRLAQVRLRDLTPQTVARFRAELEAAGVGIEAIRKTMTMLQGVLQRAVEWGRVPSNAVKLTRKPAKPHRPAMQAIPPSLIEVMRAKLLGEGRLRDATLLVVLGYAGLRPQEALALEWRHVRERTLLVERALSDGQLKALKNRRQPRTVELLAPLRDDLDAWRGATSPLPTAPVFPAASGGFWRATDWRNWRKRIYKPTAEAVGIDGARPYDLRHAFASLLIHEGRKSILEIAEQLGHNPTVCLDTYGHVMRELAGAERITAEDQVVLARKALDASSNQLRFFGPDV